MAGRYGKYGEIKRLEKLRKNKRLKINSSSITKKYLEKTGISNKKFQKLFDKDLERIKSALRETRKEG
jgi:hypothetical protein